jgi:molybdopterin/thiamine biosynthesis adenylyltransferase
MRFSDDEIRRYSRQIVLPEVGGNGQERLGAATVTAACEVEALYLAAAGVGTVIVPTELIAEAVRALNPLTRVEVGNVPEGELPVEQAALFAWRALKETLSL